MNPTGGDVPVGDMGASPRRALPWSVQVVLPSNAENQCAGPRGPVPTSCPLTSMLSSTASPKLSGPVS